MLFIFLLYKYKLYINIHNFHSFLFFILVAFLKQQEKFRLHWLNSSWKCINVIRPTEGIRCMISREHSVNNFQDFENETEAECCKTLVIQKVCEIPIVEIRFCGNTINQSMLWNSNLWKRYFVETQLPIHAYKPENYEIPILWEETNIQ